MQGILGIGFRYLYYKLRLNSMGKRVVIDVNCQIINPEYVSIGDYTWIDKNTVIIAGPAKMKDRKGIIEKSNLVDIGHIIIGKRTHIAQFTLLQGHGGLFIGSNLTIAAGSKIFSLSHHYRNLLDENDEYVYKFSSMAKRDQQYMICKPVIIHDNSAIGSNSVVLPGSIIGRNSWVGACSLVRGKIEENVIACGNPAKVIKKKLNTNEKKDSS
ncbi:MAG: acyltransferase [Candidatus Helarchaeota archaeon]